MGVDPACMGMTRDAVFVESDEHGVMVFLGVVFGFFAAFVNEPLADKGIQHLTADEPLFEEIGIHPPHGLSSWRQGKFLGFRFFLSG